MRKITIIYEPQLTIEEIASRNGCSVNTVRQYIRQQQIDRQGDNMIILLKQIRDYRKQGLTYDEIGKKTGKSYATIAKYAKMKIEETNIRSLQDENKRSAIQDGRNRSMIKSYSKDQEEILVAILNLYVGKKTFDCDLTYGDGKFYRHIPIPKSIYDIQHKDHDVRPIIEAGVLPEQSMMSVVMDPPFIIQAKVNEDSKSVIHKRYSSFSSEQELKETYYELMQLAYRLLKEKGILVIKTQDTNYNGKQIWVHTIVERYAQEIGYELEDLFIKIQDHVMLRATLKQQTHARKYHSYFYVYRKP
jgi:DNA-binding CsgD family transcriptional regulator